MADINKIIGIKVEDNASANLNKIDKGLTKVTQSTSNLNKETKSNTQALVENGGAMGLLNELTGGLAMTFKDASEAISLAGGSLKGFNGVLAASAIGAIVVTVGYLAENWERVANALKGATAEQIAYNEAANQTNISVKQTNQSIESLYNTWLKSPILQNANDINKANVALEELSKTIVVLQGLQFKLGDEANNRKVLDLINKSVDTYKEYNKTLTFRDNIQKALNKAIEDEAEAQRLYNSWLAEGAVGAESYYGDTLRKAQKTVRELRSDLDDANESLINQGIQYKISTKIVDDYKKSLEKVPSKKQEVKKEIETTINQFVELSKSGERATKILEEFGLTASKPLPVAKLPDIFDTSLERAEKLQFAIDEEALWYDERLRLFQEFNQRIKESTTLSEKEKTRILYESRMREIEIEQEKWNFITNAAANASNDILNIITVFYKDQKKASKGFAIATVIIEQARAVGMAINNLVAANAKAVAASPLTNGQPWVGINTASTVLGIAGGIAAAIKSIQAINSETLTNSSGGGNTIAAPQANFNIVESSGTNQLAATIAAQQNKPINAFVVGADVSTQQALDRNRATTATFL